MGAVAPICFDPCVRPPAYLIVSRTVTLLESRIIKSKTQKTFTIRQDPRTTGSRPFAEWGRCGGALDNSQWNFSGGLARQEMGVFLLGVCLTLKNILTRLPSAARLRVIHFASTVWRILDHGDDRLMFRTSISIVFAEPFLCFPFVPSVGRHVTVAKCRLDHRARNAGSLRLFVRSFRDPIQ